MNFNELFQKMRELDQPVNEEPNEGNAFSGALDAAKDSGKDEFEVDGKTFQVKEDDVEECGMPMPMSSTKQQDNVTMNISMNGSGAGGIRDLMDLLRDIEDGPDGGHGMDDEMGVIIDKMAGDGDSEMPLLGMDEAESGGFDQVSTTPNPQTAPLGAAFPTGNDIHSKGGNERPKVNGGGNPYAMAAEGLIPRLANLYQEVKLRESSGEQLDEFDVKLYQPHNLEFNRFGGKPPEVAAVIKKMKPADYVIYNQYKQTNPGPKLGDEDFMKWNTLAVSARGQDEYNFVQRYNRDNNNLSIAQWIEKGKNAIKGAVTGRPAEPTSYQASRSTSTIAPTTPEKEFPMKESNEIVKLSKMLNG